MGSSSHTIPNVAFSDVETVEAGSKLGWLFNMHPTTWTDPETNVQKSALSLYFIQEDGVNFRADLPFNPYFYVAVKQGHTREVENYLRRKYERHVVSVQAIQKEDLELKNHLSGITKPYLKVSFLTVQSLLAVRNEILPFIKKNKERIDIMEAYEIDATASSSSSGGHDDDEISGTTTNGYHRQGDGRNGRGSSRASASDYLLDIREYDIPYYTRVSIDLGIRVGLWYAVHVGAGGEVKLEHQKDLMGRPEARVLAFDIETTKLPLKFPDPTIDSIMMISYMLDGQGFLIINRSVVSQDIADFEYTPKPEYEGKFTVHNEPDEKGTLERFFQHIRKAKPNIIVTFNGDFFDWPFVEARAIAHGMNFTALSGVREDQGEYKGQFVAHLDAFSWVRRDSYLPQGSQGLKAVTKNKLGYDPLELNPEKMCKLASEDPHTLAQYSVSDAVATYYLYMIYIHPFIFSLCTIIPMNPHDVLRKGSGTLCESLLEAQAFKANIVFPNKHVTDPLKTFEGHLLESETYVGGHVESLESGVFRDDIDVKFTTSKSAYDGIVDYIDHTLHFALEEAKLSRDEVKNYDEIKATIADQLAKFRQDGIVKEPPAIYHVDVAAMYPNIILTNRLQPSAIVNQEICASCDFNRPENKCQRVMEWEWRGDFVPANGSELRFIREQLESEKFPVGTGPLGGNKVVPFTELPHAEQVAKIKARLKDYSKKVYKKTHTTKNLVRTDTVCMRENSFYVDTVRDFRDRRYVYKGEHKKWKTRLDKAQSAAEIQECGEMVVLYESLQLAHKCILNSFYGYVMRKGARWYSMETAGIVTYTGARIIREARETVEKIGRPLELDTDGIWCILPSSFPQNFTFTTSNPKTPKFHFSFPIMLLNAKVADKFTNDQYQTKSATDPKRYEIRNECSILFEMDGPYKAIVLPASREQDVKIKKRYAVFNKNGTLAELKGFEIKRRGELKLVKDFQAQVFDKFLVGDGLEATYASVAAVANHYLDILDTQGKQMGDGELIDLITESSNMSRKLDDYEKQRSCAITTAKRLAEFLGQQMVKEKGLACAYIISTKPSGTMVTDRAIPVAIFSADAGIRNHYIAQWLKTSSAPELREIIDWDYYRSRLASTVQKIITIPAALQKVPNPVPRVPHPDWLSKDLRAAEGQRTISAIFQRLPLGADKAADPTTSSNVVDMEDVISGGGATPRVARPVVHSRKRGRQEMEPELPRIPENPPLYRETKYTEFLVYQKAMWRRQRIMRKRALLDPGSVANEENKRNRPTPIVKSEWHVVHVRPTASPGIFVMWAVAGNTLFKINVSVPRTFYINSRIPDQSGVGKKVTLIPPRSKSHAFLYQYTMSEAKYQDNAKELSLQFTQPSIEGVYERSVPLLWRPFLELGCTCRLTATASRGPLRDTYSIEDICPSSSGTFGFHHSSSTSRPATGYLDREDLGHIYVYHSASEGRGALFAVICPQQGKGTAILVNAYAPQSKDDSTLLRPLSKKHASISFELMRAKSLEAGYKALQGVLKKLRPTGSETSSLTVMLLQSFRSGAQLAKEVPALDDFPRVSIAANAADNEYPPLNWEYQAIKTVSHRFAGVGPWWTNTLQLARYANIPIGNLEGDLTLLASDLFFARQLREAQHLLWMSSSNLPDLGGSEEDDAVFAEELINPELSEPGFYRPFCVEFDMANLAINTVLEASHISDIEGGSGLLAFEGTSDTSSSASAAAAANIAAAMNGKGTTGGDQAQQGAVPPKTYDQSNICTNEFKILRKLITRWSVDVTSSDPSISACADSLLSQFYRWISTPHALLYDPAIHRFIHDLTRKVFMQLLLEFRRFGAKIIFANYNKVIISTNKETLADAEAYSTYILSAIKKKDLFAWIDIRPLKFWENLLWMDRANYGGVEDMKNEKIVSHWNIAEYLPKAIQEYFLIIITDYILQTYKADESASTSNPHLSRSHSSLHSSTSSTDSQQQQWDSFDDQGEQHSAKHNPIIANLTQRLFAIIQDIQRTLSGDHSQADEASSEFPKLAGSHLPMNNPPLEFIKFVCHVLALDRALEQDVTRLKKNLLRLINVREFASEATFANPCLSYVLPDVMCEFCNFGRDLDLLRDATSILAPTSSSAPSSTSSSSPIFACTSCGHPYNRNHMEATLVEIVQKRDLAYQLQDLICSKCRQVKASNMGDICTNCSGQWVCKESLHAFKKSMMVFRNIADFYKFDWLLEVVNTCTSLDK